MAGYIHCVRFRLPTGYVTGGSGAAATGFPHANAADITHPHRPWRSAGNVASGSTFYGVDFGAPVTLEGVAIDNINLTSVALQAASNTAFDADLITFGYAIGQHLPERSIYTDANGFGIGRLKRFIDLAGTSFVGQARRYWRIRAASTRVDGATGPMDVGAVAWCRTLTRWPMASSGYAELPIEATLAGDDGVSGAPDPVITGNPTCAITLDTAGADVDTGRAPILELLRQGPGRPFLFFRNNGAPSDFIIARRAGDTALKQQEWTTVEFASLAMRGLV